MLEIYFTMGKPLCLEKNKDGKYELTKEEIEQIVNDAYKAGRDSVDNPPVIQPYIQPVNPVYPTYPNTPYWYDNKPYCECGIGEAHSTPYEVDTNVYYSLDSMSFGSKDVIDIKTNTSFTQTYATYGEDKDE